MQDIEQAFEDLRQVAIARAGEGAYTWMAGVLISIITMHNNRNDQMQEIRNIIAKMERLRG